ncbi:MAG: hypothetical protein ACM3TN_07050 [Alphaproteobacteria bacterium]
MSLNHRQERIAAATSFQAPFHKVGHHFVQLMLVLDITTRVVGQLYDKLADGQLGE